MTKIIYSADCGNSPKTLFLKDFNAALARGNQAAVLKRLADDIDWDWVGGARFQGREAVASMLRRMRREPPQELVMEHIITHGDAGAVNGTLRLTNGRSYGFCHVFQFRGARGTLIRGITSYEIRR